MKDGKLTLLKNRVPDGKWIKGQCLIQGWKTKLTLSAKCHKKNTKKCQPAARDTPYSVLSLTVGKVYTIGVPDSGLASPKKLIISASLEIWIIPCKGAGKLKCIYDESGTIIRNKSCRNNRSYPTKTTKKCQPAARDTPHSALSPTVGKVYTVGVPDSGLTCPKKSTECKTKN